LSLDKLLLEYIHLDLDGCFILHLLLIDDLEFLWCFNNLDKRQIVVGGVGVLGELNLLLSDLISVCLGSSLLLLDALLLLVELYQFVEFGSLQVLENFVVLQLVGVGELLESLLLHDK